MGDRTPPKPKRPRRIPPSRSVRQLRLAPLRPRICRGPLAPRGGPTLERLPDVWSLIPASRRDEVALQLQPGERPLACFEPDLEAKLRYAPGLVLLPDRR